MEVEQPAEEPGEASLIEFADGSEEVVELCAMMVEEADSDADLGPPLMVPPTPDLSLIHI